MISLKNRWIGRVSRSSGLANAILHGTLRGKSGQKKRWENVIKWWTGLNLVSSAMVAGNRTRWKGISCESTYSEPTTFKGYGIK